MFTAALFTAARTWKQPRCPLTNEWIKNLWYTYTVDYYSAIKWNTFESVLMRWMQLEPIIQSETSQKEKYKHHILTHTHIYMWNLKRRHWWISFQGSNGETDVENRPMDKAGGEEGEGERYGESNIQIYNTMCKTDSQWEFAIWLRELIQGLCDNLEGWDGEGMRGGFRREGAWIYLWLILVDVWQKTTKFCKAIILQLKKK